MGSILTKDRYIENILKVIGMAFLPVKKISKNHPQGRDTARTHLRLITGGKPCSLPQIWGWRRVIHSIHSPY
jgi:hypothetical protein